MRKWTLQIKYPQPRDSGVYECQINTEPKMSLSYFLEVVGEYKKKDLVILFMYLHKKLIYLHLFVYF